tara:strand:- start:75 stop:536 length:462 start_codon:yes stop_codon:yes gene_type:complete
MNLCIDHNNVVNENLYFIKPVKNKTRKNSVFYKLFYDNHFFVINNFIVKYSIILDNQYNIINNEENSKIIQMINRLENFLISKLIIQNNLKINNKKANLISDNIINQKDIFKKIIKQRCYLNLDLTTRKLHLKINGIWEDDNEFGFSYNILIN